MTKNQQTGIKYPEDILIDYPEKKYNRYITNEKKYNRTYKIENINDENDCIFVKEIFLNKHSNKNINYDQIYKEIYLSIKLKDYDYFRNNIEFKLSKDKKFAFLIAKKNDCSLKKFITSNYFKNLNVEVKQKLIKWIIYQITFGLYTLHSNNIIHHDIKPSNILIDSKGGISIIDFGSAIFKGKNSYENTLPYEAPELLMDDNKKVDEKYDIWGLGIIMLELYLEKTFIFRKEGIDKREDQLNYILPYFGINENNPYEFLKNELKCNKNIKFEIKKEYLSQIKDKDAVELIKNLLSFDPKERYSAEKILESDYLKEYKGVDSLKIKSIEFKEYKNISNDIGHENFIKLLEEIK